MPEENDALNDFSLNVRQWSHHDGADNQETHVSEPREITSFSRNSDREINFGSRKQLRSYVEPELYSDLGTGFDTFVPKVDEAVSVDVIIEALNKDGYNIAENADVITFRNNLNKIGGAPYNNRDDWEIDCCKVGTTLFLEIKRLPEREPTAEHKRFMYYGYRFEALCTNDADEPVNANPEFCSISRLRISNHRILVSSEIDCTTKDPTDTENCLLGYVELKTMRIAREEREMTSMYRYRYPKYWLQSYLGGVRNLVIGMRSNSGKLLEVKHINTRKLPSEAETHFRERRIRGHWDPYVCINFMDYALSCIRRACDRNPEKTIRVTYNAREGIMSGRRITSSEEQLKPIILNAMRK